MLFALVFEAGRRGINKKPTTVASRGFLFKVQSGSTSVPGCAGYNDQHYHVLVLSVQPEHDRTLCGTAPRVKSSI